MHISTFNGELWLSPERGSSQVDVLRLYIASHVSDSQCSLFLCFSRGLLQRMSQKAVLAMWQWVGVWQWSDQLVLMDSQCEVPPHWPQPSPVYKGPQQWDAGAQPKEQVEKLEVAGGS